MSNEQRAHDLTLLSLNKNFKYDSNSDFEPFNTALTHEYLETYEIILTELLITL